MHASAVLDHPSRGIGTLSDDELLRRLTELVGRSRRVEADVVAHIAEVDLRRLYAREASPSMFACCTDVLHLSEPEAYLRITAARAARAHPVLLAMLADGRLHLSGIVRLAPHLTPANSEALLARAAHKSKRQVEELVAELAPAPDVPAVIRKLPERRAPEPVALELHCPRAGREAHSVRTEFRSRCRLLRPGLRSSNRPRPRVTGSSSPRARSSARSWNVFER